MVVTTLLSVLQKLGRTLTIPLTQMTTMGHCLQREGHFLRRETSRGEDHSGRARELLQQRDTATAESLIIPGTNTKVVVKGGSKQ